MTSLKEIKSTLSSFEAFNKKQLAEFYEISINTVRMTLQACGLPTADEFYSSSDIEYRFHAARVLLTEGKNYLQIAELLNKGRSVGQVAEPSAHGYGESQSQEGASDIDYAAFAMANAAAEASTERAIQAIPSLIQMHLAKGIASPEFKQAMDRSISVMNAPTSDDDLNLFLLRGMEMVGLLPPSMQQPQASLPPSQDY